MLKFVCWDEGETFSGGVCTNARRGVRIPLPTPEEDPQQLGQVHPAGAPNSWYPGSDLGSASRRKPNAQGMDPSRGGCHETLRPFPFLWFSSRDSFHFLWATRSPSHRPGSSCTSWVAFYVLFLCVVRKSVPLFMFYG